MKRLVRGVLIAAVAVLTWCTIGAVQASGAAAWPLAVVDAAALLVVLRGATVAARGRSRQI